MRDNKDLVKRLLCVSNWTIGNKGEAVMVPLAKDAADELDRQEAEIERLRGIEEAARKYHRISTFNNREALWRSLDTISDKTSCALKEGDEDE